MARGMNRGVQFEWAIIMALININPNINLIDIDSKKLSSFKIDFQIMKDATSVATKITAFPNSVQMIYGHMSKTDIIVNGNMRISIKYTEQIQLSSAKIDVSATIIDKVVNSFSNQQKVEIKDIAYSLLNYLEDLKALQLEGPTAQIKEQLRVFKEERTRIKSMSGNKYQSELSKIDAKIRALSTQEQKLARADNVALLERKKYLENLRTNFIKAMVREFLTGELQYKSSKHKIANYLLTPKNIYPIDDNLVSILAQNTKMRTSTKPTKDISRIVMRVDCDLSVL